MFFLFYIACRLFGVSPTFFDGPHTNRGLIQARMRLLQRSPEWPSLFRTFLRPYFHQRRLLQGFRQSPSRRYKHDYKGDINAPINSKKNISKKPCESESGILTFLIGIGERILVYHAGVFFTTFVGVLKVGSILWFAYHYFRVLWWWTKRNTYEFQDRGYLPLSWRAIVLNLATGAAPLLIVWRLKPFVASARLGPVPVGARRSPQHLLQWTKKLPYDAEIEFKMLHDFGFFRRVSVPIGELRTQKPGFISMANLIRPNHPRRSIWRFLVLRESKPSYRKRIWNEIIIPQLDSVE